MNTRLLVYPYKTKSKSGTQVAEALDATKIGDGYEPKAGDFVVDWGNGFHPEWEDEFKALGDKVKVLNHWKKVAISVNKIETFEHFKSAGVPHPDWTFKQEVALKWANYGSWVCCRQEIEGMDGAGLVLAKTPHQIVPAKLYTKYKPIMKEFRVYVLGDELLDVREKRRDSDLLAAGKINPDIRTTSGGWLFCQHGFTTPVDAKSVACAATKALGLDFAGVDIIQAKDDGRCYALETNTAPYIGDNTVSKLAKGILAQQQEFVKKQIAPKWW